MCHEFMLWIMIINYMILSYSLSFYQGGGDWFSVRTTQQWQERGSNLRLSTLKYADFTTAPSLIKECSNISIKIHLIIRFFIFLSNQKPTTKCPRHATNVSCQKSKILRTLGSMWYVQELFTEHIPRQESSLFSIGWIVLIFFVSI